MRRYGGAAWALCLWAACGNNNIIEPPGPPEPGVCGNSILERGESCDDGNTVDNDGCRPDCSLPFCGDGVIDAGEVCDDGNLIGADACDNSCQPSTCNNNASEQGEVCYQPAAQIAVGALPFAVVTADMNGDQQPDLVVTEAATLSVAVLLGDGQGGFSAPLRATTNNSPFSLVVSDLDGDGDLDVATGNNVFDDNGDITASSLSTFLNDGAGQLTVQENATPIQATFSLGIAAGDFNSDGRNDLAIPGLFTANVSILSNNVGAFAESVVSFDPFLGFFTSQPFSAVGADLDNDGDDDLVIADGASPSLRLMRNQAGSLSEEESALVGFGQGFVATGDLDGNQDIDLVSVAFGGAAVNAVFNDGAGDFSRFSGAFADGPSSAVIADVNGDGLGDLISADSGGLFGPNPKNTVTVFVQDAAGAFGPVARFTVGVGPSSIVSADFNQDGAPDFATTNLNENTVSVLLSGQ